MGFIQPSDKVLSGELTLLAVLDKIKNDCTVATSSASGVECTGFASRYRFQSKAGFYRPKGRCKVITSSSFSLN